MFPLAVFLRNRSLFWPGRSVELVIPFLELLQRLQDRRVLRRSRQERLEVILPVISDHSCEGGFGLQVLLQVGQRKDVCVEVETTKAVHHHQTAKV